MAINTIITTAVDGFQKSADRVKHSAGKIVRLNNQVLLPIPTINPAVLSGNNAIDAQLIGSRQTGPVEAFAN